MHPKPTDQHEIARALSRELDSALCHGATHAADALADAIVRLGCVEPAVLEPVARLHYARGDVQHALDVIDAADHTTASLALLAACCLLRLGRRAEAVSALSHQVRLGSDLPEASRHLLALLSAEDGDLADAIELLRRTCDSSDNHSAAAALVCALVEADRFDEAHTVLHEMLAAHVQTAQWPSPLLFARSLGVAESTLTTEPTTRDVEMLAEELITHESLIETLVEWQRLTPNESTLRLLHRALLYCASRLQDPAAACAAQVHIARLLGDETTAQRWLTVGLHRYPMSLALRSLQPEPERDFINTQQRMAA